MEDRILVVDDEKEIRELLLKALTRLSNFRVELAEDGEEALKKIEQGNFDLVLTDMRMPKMDGLQLAAEIPKSKPEILTVLMTGHGTFDSALEVMKQGASDYLMKPLNLEEMVVRLSKVLEERQRFVKLRDFAAHLERAGYQIGSCHYPEDATSKRELFRIAREQLRG